MTTFCKNSNTTLQKKRIEDYTQTLQNKHYSTHRSTSIHNFTELYKTLNKLYNTQKTTKLYNYNPFTNRNTYLQNLTFLYNNFTSHETIQYFYKKLNTTVYNVTKRYKTLQPLQHVSTKHTKHGYTQYTRSQQHYNTSLHTHNCTHICNQLYKLYNTSQHITNM